jgi:dolichol-phosphate mannosyltransferase
VISVVVPTYNEAENLPVLVERLHKAFGGGYEVVVVDDSSPDGTALVAESLARDFPVRVVVRRGRWMGLAGAVVEGARAALGEVVVVMDADLQHPPEVAPLLAARVLAGADLAVGTRYGRGGGIEGGWPAARRIISRGASLLAKLLLPEARPLSDPMSGFFAARRACLSSISPTGRYKILLDVLSQCRPAEVVEVPYVFRPRHAGRSKLGLRHMADYVLQLMRITGWRPLKFALVGATGVGVAEAVLYALPLPYWLAAVPAIETSLTTNFALNNAWTFRDRKAPWLRGWLKYHVANLAGIAANYATSNALVLAGVSKYLAYVVGVVAGFLANYLLSETYVFGRKAVDISPRTSRRA